MRRPGPIRRPAAGVLPLKSLTAVDRALLRASVVEVNKLEKRVPFLATTASIAPFIGLFGTVWGIMMRVSSDRRDRLDQPRRSSRPASPKRWSRPRPAWSRRFRPCYFYNHLSQRVKLFASEMDDFALEFLNIAERNFT